MQDNALPRTARATVSRRILAGEPVDAAESTLNEVLAKQRIDLNSDPDDSRAHAATSGWPWRASSNRSSSGTGWPGG